MHGVSTLVWATVKAPWVKMVTSDIKDAQLMNIARPGAYKLPFHENGFTGEKRTTAPIWERVRSFVRIIPQNIWANATVKVDVRQALTNLAIALEMPLTIDWFLRPHGSEI